MTDLLAARSQMAVSLGFPIIFAMVGVAMPVLVVVSERRGWGCSGPVSCWRWSSGPS